MRASRAIALLALVNLALPAFAQAAAIARLYSLAGGDGGFPQPVFLDLVVNGVRRDAVLVELTPDDVWAGADDLRAAGLVDFRGARRASGGRELVSLRSLAPELRFDVDDLTLVLDLTASAAILRRSRLDLAPNARPPGAITSSVPSAFLNYAARVSTIEDPSGAGELGLSLGRGDLLLSGVTVQPGGDVVRGLTTLTVDRPERLLRFDAGDVLFAQTGLGGGAVVLGAGVARDFSLDPYVVQAPLPALSAFAATPSTVEVWVNGQLMRRETVLPGTYDLSNLPTTAGTNDVRVVVRDAFGRTQTVEASPYLGARLLAPGVHDFAVAAGARRERLGIESFDYGSPVLFARERLGLTDRLTVGARFEASSGLASGGVSVDAVAPVGEVQAEVAASGDHGEAGAAATGSWQLRRRAWSTAAYLRWASPRYATASLSAASDRETLRAGAIASLYATPRLTFSGELATALRRDASRETVLDLRAMYTLAMGQMLAVEARTSSAPGRSTVVGVFASVVFQAGGGASGSMAARARSDNTGGASIGLQKPLPFGPGYGYDLRATSLERESQVNALAEAQSTFGRAEATYDQIGGTRSGSFSVAGGVVALREGVFLARPVEQSFALVQVGDVPGVRTYLENQPMGSTDGSGKILVPSLGAFRANRISIADGDVPIDRTIPSRELLVVAPRRAGAVARFAADRLQAVTGRLRVLDAAGVATPVGGMIRLGVDGRVISSPIGEDGTFWLENVPAGSHPAEIFWRGRLCRFSVPVPDARPGLQDLGELACGTQPRSERRDLTPDEMDALTRGEPGALPPPAPVHAPADVARATP